MDKKLILRIILSPVILFWGFFVTCAMLIFPLPLIIGLTFIHLLMYPILLLLEKVGTNVDIEEPFINITPHSYLLGYVLTITIPIWVMFFYTIHFIKTGELYD